MLLNMCYLGPWLKGHDSLYIHIWSIWSTGVAAWCSEPKWHECQGCSQSPLKHAQWCSFFDDGEIHSSNASRFGFISWYLKKKYYHQDIPPPRFYIPSRNLPPQPRAGMPHWLREAAAAGHAWLGLQRLLAMLLLNLCFRPDPWENRAFFWDQSCWNHS